MTLAPIQEIEALGADVGHTDDGLAMLAYRLTELAALGVLDLDDTERAYDAWQSGRSKGGGIGRRSRRTVGSKPQQVSKLRRFIKLGKAVGKKAIELLRRVAALYESGFQLATGEKQREKGLYGGLVDAARRQIKKGNVMLTDSEIRQIFVH